MITTCKTIMEYSRRLLMKLLVTIAILYITIFSVLGFIRIIYPYELWWYEGDALRQVIRILSGKPLYTSPSYRYIPMIYSPLFFYVAAIFAKIFGLQLSVLRFISVASTIGSLGVIFLCVKKETQKNTFAVISAGLFAATYQLSGGVMDTARVDSLFIFLLLLSLYFSTYSKNSFAHLFAACLFFLSCITKQSGIIMLPFICWFYIGRKHKLLQYLITFILLFCSFNFVFNTQTHGWYWYYDFQLPQLHLFDIRNILTFIVFYLPSILIATIFTGLYICKRYTKKNNTNSYWVPLFAGLFIISIIGVLNMGGSSNILIPMHAGIAIGFGISIDNFFHSKNNALFKFAITLFGILQFIILIYNPLTFIPNKVTQINTKKLITYINKQKGAVFIPSNNFLLSFTNKPHHANMHMANELLGGYGSMHPKKEGIILLSDFKQKIRSGFYEVIILDKYDYYMYYYKLLEHEINARYVKDNKVFYVWKGQQNIPLYIYIKRN